MMNREKEAKESKTEELQYLFLLSTYSPEFRRETYQFLTKLGVRITIQHGNKAMIGYSPHKVIDAARETKRFIGIFSESIEKEDQEKFDKELLPIIEQWNFHFTEEYKKIRDDTTHKGKKWNSEGYEEPKPFTYFDPQFFKSELLKFLKTDEETLAKEYDEYTEKFPKLEGAEFIKFERELAKKLDNETVAYYVARIIAQLPSEYYYAVWSINSVIDYIQELFKKFFFFEPECWKLENEISVGVVFVESSIAGGPTFTAAERTTLSQEIMDGLNWLANSEVKAQISWVIDWQFCTINVANGNNNSNESYWRNPAMQQVNYNGNTYTGDWDGVIDYRDDMRKNNWSAHAFVIFVTPYANEWFAYANSVYYRITLANRNNWGGWGINTLDSIVVHETCHLFGAADEYTGAGTPCASCGGQFGCYKIPNGNCGACAQPHQDCLMDQNTLRLCAYTQAHIGWADLFVELTTANENGAGTNDTVSLDIGETEFQLQPIPIHDDLEQGYIDGYNLNYSGVHVSDIRKVLIQKGPDGLSGNWKLAHIRLWCRGTLVCDTDVNKWFQGNDRSWTSKTCGTFSTIGSKVRGYNWTSGWTTAEFYWIDNTTFLFLLKEKGTGADGNNVHIHRMESDGSVGGRVKSYKWTEGWTTAEFYRIGGTPFLFLLKEKGTGADGNNIHIHRMKPDGSVGGRVKSYKWTEGWTTAEFYWIGRTTFLFLLKEKGTGADGNNVHIHRIKSDGPVGGRVKSYKWTEGWTTAEFFRIDGTTFLFLLKEKGTGADAKNIHIHRMKSDGSVGGRVKNYKWTEGWTTIEFYEPGTIQRLFLLKEKGTGVDGKNVHIHKMKSSTVGTKIEAYRWSEGWTIAEFYRINGQLFLFLLKRSNGIVHIHKIVQI